MYGFLAEHWQLAITSGHIVLALFAAGHVVLRKRNPRAATGWLGFIWVAPIAGSLIYFWIGVNRIERRANRRRPHVEVAGSREGPPATALGMGEVWVEEHLTPLDRLIGRVTGQPLLGGNTVEVLRDGDEAYPAMIAAIDEATSSVAMCTYIFEAGPAGRTFVEALRRAVDRGIEVRVLIDDIGSRYSWLRVPGLLTEVRVPFATFLPTWKPRWFHGANLRNHRKLLIVDGFVGFTGGMNIRQEHLAADNRPAIRDLQFRFEGPVVRHMSDVFAVDWSFATGERLSGETWFPRIESRGDVLARGIADGPDEDLDAIERVLQGAIDCARSSITIVTPYFVPDEPLIGALTTASLRGVEVNVLVPARNNLPVVRWASMAGLAELVERGCHVWESRPPFDHSKLLVVDRTWSLVGSANWDDRSLRLNFEFDVECHDRRLAEELSRIADERIAECARLTSERLASRSLFVRLRDGCARLASPYL